MSKSTNRVGLSEYTARRLAELRARRAEADDNGGFSASSNPLNHSLANGSSRHQNGVTEVQSCGNGSVSALANDDSVPATSHTSVKLRSDYFSAISETSIQTVRTVHRNSSLSVNSLPSESNTPPVNESMSTSLYSKPTTTASSNGQSPSPVESPRFDDSLVKRHALDTNENKIISNSSDSIDNKLVTNSVTRTSNSFRGVSEVASPRTFATSQSPENSSGRSSLSSVEPAYRPVAAGPWNNSDQQPVQYAADTSSPRPAVCAKPSAAAIASAVSSSAYLAVSNQLLGRNDLTTHFPRGILHPLLAIII